MQKRFVSWLQSDHLGNSPTVAGTMAEYRERWLL